MLFYLGEPYPDEPLYSVIARYISCLTGVKRSRAIECLFGRKIGPRVEMPNSLDTLSVRTYLLWRLTGKQIADRFTLFPYYASYMPNSKKQECLGMLLSDNSTGIQAKLGMTQNRIKTIKFLRFCKICKEEDINKCGETFWRRIHQLAGVLVCPYHGEILTDTPVPMNPKGLGDFYDANTVTAKIEAQCKSILSKNERELALKIARRCQEMISGPIAEWPNDNVAGAYHRAAIKNGFIEGAKKLSPSKLEKAFMGYYGKHLLQQLQCDFAVGRNSNWFRNIFRASRKSFHPLEHVLIQLFLESTEKITNKNPLGPGPWKCPNSFGKHAEEYPIKDPYIYAGYKHRKIVASAKCSCGFEFTFHEVDKTDFKMPIVSKVMRHGPAWEAEVRRLREDGLSMLAIGNKLGIRDTAVKKLLSGKEHLYVVTKKDIAKWRREWTKLISRVPQYSRSAARNKNRSLYLRLWRNDRHWLLSTPRRWNHNPVQPCRIDWDKRDKDWSVLIRAASKAIADLLPVKKITQTAVLVEAGISRKALHNLHRLPRCRVALLECLESQEAYQCRRLLAAARKIEQNGLTLYPSVLLRCSSLRKVLLTEKQNKLLNELTIKH